MLSIRSLSSLVDGMGIASRKCVPGVQDGLHLFGAELTGSLDLVHHAGRVRAELTHKCGGFLAQLGGFDLVEHAVGGEGQQNDLLGVGFGLVQRLFQQLHQSLAVFQLAAGLSVQVRAELREGFHILVLGQLDTQVGVGLFHGLGLGSAADTGNRQANVDSRAVACVEQCGLQEDLAIGDGNNVGGNVGGNIACLV